MRRPSGALLLALAGAGFAAPAPAVPSLVGIWYGEGQPVDPTILSLLEFRADGTFVDEFRSYDKCKVVWSQRLTGTWSVSGNEQTLVTVTMDGKPVHYVNHYTTEMLTDTAQHARHRETGYLYRERRVERFEFPDCFNGV